MFFANKIVAFASGALLPLVVVAVAACGGSGEAPAQSPGPTRQEAPASSRPRMQVRGELGSVDESAVRDVFRGLEPKFAACQREGLARISVLAGSLKFFVRIGEDGRAKWAVLEETDLGDRDTERCLTDAALTAPWPRPDGGEAEARYTMELPPDGSRPATPWLPERISKALSQHGDAVEQCKAGAHGPLRATMYVGPGGHVLAAGVAVAHAGDLERADCLAASLLRLKGLPSPGSWPAKVSFAP